MSLWILIVLFGLIKLPLAVLMLWLPFRSDAAMSVFEEDGHPAHPESDDEGGTKTLSGGSPEVPRPRLPLPHRPRRGPHGSPSPLAPARVRTSARRVTARAAMQR